MIFESLTETSSTDVNSQRSKRGERPKPRRKSPSDTNNRDEKRSPRKTSDTVTKRADVYAGSAYLNAPDANSLPLPTFSKSTRQSSTRSSDTEEATTHFFGLPAALFSTPPRAHPESQRLEEISQDLRKILKIVTTKAS